MSDDHDASAAQSGLLRRPWVLALGVLLLSLGATLAVWHLSSNSQIRRDRDRVNRFVGRFELELRTRLAGYEDITRGAQGFFATEAALQPADQWRDYVELLDLPRRRPGLASLAFVARVGSSDLEAYLKARPQLAGRYHRPASDPLPLRAPDQGGDHLIIELCEPGARSAKALGLDVGASLTQRLAAERAEETGQPALSGLLHFSQPGSQEHALALFVPVFRGNPSTPEARHATLKGWVSAGILIRPLVEDVLQGEDGGLAVEVVDAYAAQGPQQLFISGDWPREAKPDATQALDLAGRGWELRFAIKPSFYQVGGRRQPLILLAGGAALSLALSALVWSLAGTRRRAVDLAQKMNAELHEALQRNQSHLAFTPLAVIETDSAFAICEWNHAAERMFGYSRADALGKDPDMLVPPEGRAEAEAHRRALLNSRSGIHTTLENLTSRGGRIQCAWFNAALRNEQGRFIGALLLADDITARRRSEAALFQSQKLESLGVLSGGIAHDFNNLLTAILGNTEVAQDIAGGDPALQSALQRIEATAQRGADLARQLLAYAGKAHFEVRPLDLNTIILEMGDLLSVSISKKVALRLDLEPELPSVAADSAQFQQVVMNLVINASEAIGDQTGTVTLRTRSVLYDREQLSESFPGQVLEPGPYVRMEVEDDGCGMDAETIGRIFDPFFTTKFTGRGLGLSAMLGIVRGHRAGIRVSSVPDRGTTFILLFPASSTPLAAPQPGPFPNYPSTGTILVVDDEGIIRDLARNALENAGFRVLEARDGLEAVERFKQDGASVHLVLLDMTMPRMGGAEAFRRIRELSPGVKVLLTSGYTQKESLLSLADLPPDGFLQKPFRVRELVGKVRELLRNHSDRIQNQ